MDETKDRVAGNGIYVLDDSHRILGAMTRAWALLHVRLEGNGIVKLNSDMIYHFKGFVYFYIEIILQRGPASSS